MKVIESDALSHVRIQAQSWPFIIQRMWLRPSNPDPRLWHTSAGNSNTLLFLNITFIYFCWICSQNSSLNLCQPKRRKRGTTPWKMQLLLTEWMHSCLFDIQRGISRWDHEWQNVEHSRIIDRAVLVKRPEWDLSVYDTKKGVQLGWGWAGWGGLRPPRNSLSLFFCTLLILWPSLDERLNMQLNMIEKKLSSTLNNIAPKV